MKITYRKKNWLSPLMVPLLFCLLCGIHFSKVADIFPPRTIFSSEFMTSGEHLLDAVAIKRDQAFRNVSGKSWGFDPYLMGGYVSAEVINSDRRAGIVLARFFGGITAVKLLIFLSIFLGPLLLFFFGSSF